MRSSHERIFWEDPLTILKTRRNSEWKWTKY